VPDHGHDPAAALARHDADADVACLLDARQPFAFSSVWRFHDSATSCP
jgi:hypothetical protein